MKFVPLTLFAFFILKTTFAQDNSSGKADSIYKFVSQKPQFPGGDSAMATFLNSNLQYPYLAMQIKVEGSDIARFVVNKDGSVSDIEVLRDIGYGCKEEVMRVLAMMPHWIPGQLTGNVVRSYYYLPVEFKLSKPNPNAPIQDPIEAAPQFPGGQGPLLDFIEKNLIYPDKAKAKKIQGSVIMQFVVDETGTISDITCMKDIGGGCAEEAFRIIKLMPNWIPATQNGNPVKVYFILPIHFHFTEN